LRDLCEVEFWEVLFFGTRYNGLFNVYPHATPHYQIVDLESFFSLVLIFKGPTYYVIAAIAIGLFGISSH